MDKENLRPVEYSTAPAVYNRIPTKGYFHKWITKVYNDEPGCEHVFGLIEEEDGTMVMVDAPDIKFTDRG